jgi:GLPGLI family protein
LPGLILEIGDDNRVMICTKVVLNPDEKIKLKEPKKGQVVSNLEFETIQQEKAKEMRERFQRGGGRGSNRSSRLN